jgi:hypothetical protein
MRTHRWDTLTTGLFALGLLLLFPASAVAHCDGLDGPVVMAAQKALASGEVEHVLVWVQKGDEQDIREAFAHTLAVRALGVEARELADKYFFETLVRIHRNGEGAPYTGLKPAGRDLGPAIPLADRVLASGRIEPLVTLLADETRRGLIERFERAVKTRKFPASDLEAGRAYVRAYVEFIHYVERAYEAASRPAAGHYPEAAHTLETHEH